jgi:hypothetical protein
MPYYEGAMSTSVRLDEKTRRLLDRLARDEGKSKSDVIRDAIHEHGKARSSESVGPSVYESIQHLVGIVEGGDPALSQRTGERFAEILRQKATE